MPENGRHIQQTFILLSIGINNYVFNCQVRTHFNA